MGSSQGMQGMPFFALLVNTDFALPIKLFLSQTTIFLTFTFPVLSPVSLRGSEQEDVWGSATHWGYTTTPS